MDASERKDIEGSEARDVPDVNEVCGQILKGFGREPAHRAALRKMLVYCDTPRSLSEINETAGAFPEMRGAWQSPQVLMTWLVEAGGLEALAGKSEEPRWQTTEAGRLAVESENAQNRLETLLEEKDGKYRDVYLQILTACKSPKSRDEIEAMLKGNPALENPKIYASYFLQNLEKREAVVFKEKWETTESYSGVISEEKEVT